MCGPVASPGSGGSMKLIAEFFVPGATNAINYYAHDPRRGER
jgi:hypothetical protein